MSNVLSQIEFMKNTETVNKFISLLTKLYDEHTLLTKLSEIYANHENDEDQKESNSVHILQKDLNLDSNQTRFIYDSILKYYYKPWQLNGINLVTLLHTQTYLKILRDLDLDINEICKVIQNEQIDGRIFMPGKHSLNARNFAEKFKKIKNWSSSKMSKLYMPLNKQCKAKEVKFDKTKEQTPFQHVQMHNYFQNKKISSDTTQSEEETVLDLFMNNYVNECTNNQFDTVVPDFNLHQNHQELTSLHYVYNPVSNEQPHWLKIKIDNQSQHKLIFNDITPSYLRGSFQTENHQIEAKSQHTYYIYNTNVDDEVRGHISYIIQKGINVNTTNNYSERTRNKLIVLFDELNNTCNVDIAATTNSAHDLFRNMEKEHLQFQHRGDVMCHTQDDKLLSVTYFKSTQICICGSVMQNISEFQKCCQCDSEKKIHYKCAENDLHSSRFPHNDYYLCTKCSDRSFNFINTDQCDCGSNFSAIQIDDMECVKCNTKNNFLKCTDEECNRVYNLCMHCRKKITLRFGMLSYLKNNKRKPFTIIIQNETKDEILHIDFKDIEFSDENDKIRHSNVSEFYLGCDNTLEIEIGTSDVPEETYYGGLHCAFINCKTGKKSDQTRYIAFSNDSNNHCKFIRGPINKTTGKELIKKLKNDSTSMHMTESKTDSNSIHMIESNVIRFGYIYNYSSQKNDFVFISKDENKDTDVDDETKSDTQRILKRLKTLADAAVDPTSIKREPCYNAEIQSQIDIDDCREPNIFHYNIDPQLSTAWKIAIIKTLNNISFAAPGIIFSQNQVPEFNSMVVEFKSIPIEFKSIPELKTYSDFIDNDMIYEIGLGENWPKDQMLGVCLHEVMHVLGFEHEEKDKGVNDSFISESIYSRQTGSISEVFQEFMSMKPFNTCNVMRYPNFVEMNVDEYFYFNWSSDLEMNELTIWENDSPSSGDAIQVQNCGRDQRFKWMWYVPKVTKRKAFGGVISNGYWLPVDSDSKEDHTKNKYKTISKKHLDKICSVLSYYSENKNVTKNKLSPFGRKKSENDKETIVSIKIMEEKEYKYDLFWWNYKGRYRTTAIQALQDGSTGNKQKIHYLRFNKYNHTYKNKNILCSGLQWKYYSNDDSRYKQCGEGCPEKQKQIEQLEATFLANIKENFDPSIHLLNPSRLTQLEEDLKLDPKHKIYTFSVTFSATQRISNMEQNAYTLDPSDLKCFPRTLVRFINDTNCLDFPQLMDPITYKTEHQPFVVKPGKKIGWEKRKALSPMDKVMLNLKHPPTINETYEPEKSEANGLYYCGRARATKGHNHPSFDIDTDGRCGPTNGPNCAACRVIKNDNIPTYNYDNYENSTDEPYHVWQGRSGYFYCGRYFGRQNKKHDGFCGPNNGAPCFNCKKLVVGEFTYSQLNSRGAVVSHDLTETPEFQYFLNNRNREQQLQILEEWKRETPHSDRNIGIEFYWLQNIHSKKLKSHKTIYYTIDERLIEEWGDAIMNAIDVVLANAPGIVFEKRSVTHPRLKRIQFIHNEDNHKSSTNSNLLRGNTARIKLGKQSEKKRKGTALHELLHALGFQHEFKRKDR
eukprot:38687_1